MTEPAPQSGAPAQAREIALDLETTGLDAASGDRVVEIGCVELRHLLPSGQTYQTHVNPERSMSEGARAITGLTDEFLQSQPRFADVVDAFLEFLGDSPLVIYNADFDIKFLNTELKRLARPPIAPARVIDGLALARAQFPGQPNSLDAVCQRFGIDISARTKHGALLDAELLAQAYLHLRGGRQRRLGLGLEREEAAARARPAGAAWPALPPRPQALPLRLDAQDKAAHLRFLQDSLKDAVWLTPPRG